MADYNCKLGIMKEEMSSQSAVREWLNLCYNYKTVSAYCSELAFGIEKIHTTFGPEYYIQGKKKRLLETMHQLETKMTGGYIFDIKAYERRTG